MTRSGYGSEKGPSVCSWQETDMLPDPVGVHDPHKGARWRVWRDSDTQQRVQKHWASRASPRRTRTAMAENDLDTPEALLTPSEVAALFRVNPKTVTRWARAGKLTAIRTLGGHRRFRVSEIRRCLEEMSREEV